MTPNPVVSFIVHNAAGEILRTGSCPQDMMAQQAGAGETAIEGQANDVTQFVFGGVVTDKPALGASIDKLNVAADGVDLVTVSGLPNPTAFTITGPVASSGTVVDGALQLSFDYLGTYTLTLRAVNKLDQTFTVTAA